MADLFINERLMRPEPLLFVWAMLPGEHQVEAIGRGAVDGVLCDMQHGLIGYRDMVAMVRGIQRGGKPAFVRPPLDDFATVSRALDAGAAAIVMPMINTAGDAEQLVAAGKFPPAGERSWGPAAAIDASGLDGPAYLAGANDLTKVFGLIETADALANLDDICAVPGLDGVFVGPNDLSISLSRGKVAGVEYRGVQEALPLIVAAARQAGKVSGIYASGWAQVRQFADLGFSFISVANDRTILGTGLDAVLSPAGE